MFQQEQRTQHSQADDIMAIREREVAERIRSNSDTFTIRQMANIHKMSIPFLRDFAERHGITFVGTDGNRTKRLSSAAIKREKQHTSAVVARSVSRKPVTSLDADKITPELRERARRRDQETGSSNTSVNCLLHTLVSKLPRWLAFHPPSCAAWPTTKNWSSWARPLRLVVRIPRQY